MRGIGEHLRDELRRGQRRRRRLPERVEQLQLRDQPCVPPAEVRHSGQLRQVVRRLEGAGDEVDRLTRQRPVRYAGEAQGVRYPATASDVRVAFAEPRPDRVPCYAVPEPVGPARSADDLCEVRRSVDVRRVAGQDPEGHGTGLRRAGLAERGPCERVGSAGQEDVPPAPLGHGLVLLPRMPRNVGHLPQPLSEAVHLGERALRMVHELTETQCGIAEPRCGTGGRRIHECGLDLRANSADLGIEIDSFRPHFRRFREQLDLRTVRFRLVQHMIEQGAQPCVCAVIGTFGHELVPGRAEPGVNGRGGERVDLIGQRDDMGSGVNHDAYPLWMSVMMSPDRTLERSCCRRPRIRAVLAPGRAFARALRDSRKGLCHQDRADSSVRQLSRQLSRAAAPGRVGAVAGTGSGARGVHGRLRRNATHRCGSRERTAPPAPPLRDRDGDVPAAGTRNIRGTSHDVTAVSTTTAAENRCQDDDGRGADRGPSQGGDGSR